jgi:hypothetical protein
MVLLEVSRLFKIARVLVRFQSRCQLHRKRESQHNLTGYKFCDCDSVADCIWLPFRFTAYSNGALSVAVFPWKGLLR